MSVHPNPATHLAQSLADHGTDVAFGVPGGGSNLDVIGAFADNGIDFVLAHTETAACIMASTWGWLSDRTTAVVVTRGPGAASAVNGAAQATLDRQPLLLITDTVAQAQDGVLHQRIDQQAMLAPVSKGSAVVGSATTVADVTAAIDLATTWPYGCVHLDYDASQPGTPPTNSAHAVARDMDTAALDQARKLITAADRPVVIVGVGAVDAAEQVRHAVGAFGAPVLTTYQASGIVPSEATHAAGLYTNGATEKPLLDRADVVVMIGVDLAEPRPGNWTHTAPIVSLATVPTADPYFPLEVELVGDLAELVPQVFLGDHDWEPTAGRDHNRRVRTALAEGAPSDVLSPVSLTTTLAEATPSDATVTVDAGAHFLAILPFWPTTRPRQILISNGLATMGYAVPAAIGAALAEPARPVIALTGDGGLGMCLSELETIARRQLPITVVVYNDATLSLIKIKQRADHGGENAVRYGMTDFAAVARAMGMPAVTVDGPSELSATLAAHDDASPLLIDAQIDPSSYPHLIEVTRG